MLIVSSETACAWYNASSSRCTHSGRRLCRRLACVDEPATHTKHGCVQHHLATDLPVAWSTSRRHGASQAVQRGRPDVLPSACSAAASARSSSASWPGGPARASCSCALGSPLLSYGSDGSRDTAGVQTTGGKLRVAASSSRPYCACGPAETSCICALGSVWLAGRGATSLCRRVDDGGVSQC